METVFIWSDGGPKHFKVSANIRFILSLQQVQPEIDWSYNFFPSYHRCSVYNRAASHIKPINRSMKDEQKAIQTSKQVVSVIQSCKIMKQLWQQQLQLIRVQILCMESKNITNSLLTKIRI